MSFPPSSAAPFAGDAPPYKPTLRRCTPELWTYVWARHGSAASGVAGARPAAWFKALLDVAVQDGALREGDMTAAGMRQMVRSSYAEG